MWLVFESNVVTRTRDVGETRIRQELGDGTKRDLGQFEKATVKPGRKSHS
jgi:hypothetical protein